VTVIRRFSRAESPAIRPSRKWFMTGSGRFCCRSRRRRERSLAPSY